MIEFNIQPLSNEFAEKLQHKINFKTKPLGSLGKLESTALQIGKIQNSLSPEIKKPTILIFAGDHGVVESGVSAFPQEVTFQMVMNFLSGGAAINVFSQQHDIQMKIIDAGVNFDFEASPQLIDLKVAKGTKNFLTTQAMTEEECQLAVQRGADLVAKLHEDGTNLIGCGEMGIGNTSSASMLMSVLGGVSIEECVGRGTGLDDKGLQKKLDILTKAMNHHKLDGSNPAQVLATFGGFEIAMMVGAYLKAAELKMTIVVDGFITTAAILVASKMNPAILEYCIFSHQSDESGHKKMLEILGGNPLIQLGMRLGEGSGVAVAYPLIASAVEFLNKMASFDDAGVSEKND